MESFFSLLERRVDDCSSLLCVGLDPHVDELKPATADEARDHCLRLVKATAPFAAAFKPNAAFFERFGADGWTALKQVIEAIRDESQHQGSHIPVILDAKRGDIASTAEAYAASAFLNLGADGITLSPYLGRDSIEPFIREPEHGAFLLCKTSNPGAGDLQDLPVQRAGRETAPLYLQLAELARGWNTRGNVGLVVGATYPETLREVRSAAPELWFLVPGVGTQGGDMEAALRAGLRKDGKGLLINISRGISRALDPRKAAAELRDAMLTARTSAGKLEPQAGAHAAKEVLADALLEAGCVKFGEFALKSGLKSPIYIDLRLVISYPQLLGQIGSAYVQLLKDLEFDRLAAVPYAAIPIATAISLQAGYPMVYPRKEAKTYGTKADIEGAFHAGERVVLIDDLATTGGSKFEAIEKLTAAGLKVRDVVVLIDRQSGAGEALQAEGYLLHAVLSIREMLDHWEKTGQVEKDRIQAAREFVAASRGQG
jgi:uridine monophosphate synthetase